MNMKKIVFYLAAFISLMSGCGQKTDNTKELAFAQQRDSLESIIQQKDNEINDIMGTMNDIEAGFRAINEAEQRVSVARQSEGISSTERIRENMQYIQEAMQQNRELINKLRNQVRQGSVKSEQLKLTIDNLTRQMEEKDTQIRQLQAELQAKDVQIGELTEKVEDLSNNVSTLREETTQKSQTISTQDKQLNTAWFVYGTKSELKEQHILQDGKVLQSNFNREYFTKIDIRVDKEIRLYSRSAKLLTAHPQSSYTLLQDANKQYILRITNPQLFWSTSKYLVVLVK
jgi:chromosome segregation ATPase